MLKNIFKNQKVITSYVEDDGIEVGIETVL